MLDAINNVFRKLSDFHDVTGRLKVDGMNIISYYFFSSRRRHTRFDCDWSSRVLFRSAQKANTGNAFSLPHLALSTANLYAATQPGGTLFGLQESNPTNEEVAYGGNAADYGTLKDFMVGKRIGGINVFGGGLALYDADGTLVGGLGVSGDASCADHNIAWKMRYNLQLDHVPAGVADGGEDDNIIYDYVTGVSNNGVRPPQGYHAATPNGQAPSTQH